jgi:hypothetical protein
VAVGEQQQRRQQQDGERRQAEQGGEKPGPGWQRQAKEAHAAGAALEGGDDEVGRRKQRRHTKQSETRQPQRLAGALARARGGPHGAERRIGRPAGKRTATRGENRCNLESEGGQRDPVARGMEARQSHAGRPDLERQQVAAESALGRQGQGEKDHQGAVDGHQRQVEFRRHHATGGLHWPEPFPPGDFGRRVDDVEAHQQGERLANEGGGEGQPEVADADGLVAGVQPAHHGWRLAISVASQRSKSARGSTSSTLRIW